MTRKCERFTPVRRSGGSQKSAPEAATKTAKADPKKPDAKPAQTEEN